MKINYQFFKVFAVLLFSTAFIFSFSHFGAMAFEKLVTENGNYAKGTKVGNIDISGKTESEAKGIVQQKYAEWLRNAKFIFQYSEKNVPFDLNLFKLDSETTINSIKDGQKNQVYITVNQAELEKQINIDFPQLNSKEVDLNKLKTNLEADASKFENGSFTYNLNYDYLLANAVKKDFIISEEILKLKEVPSQLQMMVEKSPEIKIEEKADFSLLEFAKKQKFASSEALSVMATGIYQAILPTNFLIVDRSISSALPDYALLGLEAKVSPAKNTDLMIKNPNKTAYTLVLNLNNNVLKVSLKGEKLLYNYKISNKDEQLLKPKTIVQYSPLLKSGKSMVKAEGSDGKFVKVYREIYQGGQLLKSELISEDYYPPVYRVEIHALTGTKQGATTNTGSQSGSTTNSTTSGTNSNGQTASTSDVSQQDSNSDGLWGKSNEQPK